MRNKKKLYLLMIMAACMLCSVSTSASEIKTTAVSTKKTVKPRISCWVKYKGYSYYFDSKGKKLKNVIRKMKGKFYYFDKYGRVVISKFIRYGKQVYFANKKGEFLTGWNRINGKRFYFNERGRALPGLQKIGGETYYFSWRGEIRTGWHIINGKKYYFHSQTGKMLKNRTINGIRINRKGEAPLTTSERLDLKCQEILKKITTSSMSKQEKIRACYDYVVSKNNFSYTTWRNFAYYDDWSVDYAYEMLTKKMGNCYNFACAFAYLARAAGCDVTIVRGRVHGSRDHAADGFTRHCWTIVDGLYYDPELAFAGSASVYGYSSYPLTCQITGYDVLK